MEFVEDRLVGGKVVLRQPVGGYRAATDPVLLAAAAPARAGDSVLDLGCGVGAAALCLASRVDGLTLSGLEVQPGYAALARENAALNKAPFEVITGDLRAMPAALKQQSFDHVITNPPWHPTEALGSPDGGRDLANRLGIDLQVWLAAALARLRPRGWLTLIQRAEWLPVILSDLSARAGDIAVLPLASRAGRPAKRVIVRARKGSGGPFRLLPPFVLHEGDTHPGDRDHFTEAARRILRDGEALDF